MKWNRTEKEIIEKWYSSWHIFMYFDIIYIHMVWLRWADAFVIAISIYGEEGMISQHVKLIAVERDSYIVVFLRVIKGRKWMHVCAAAYIIVPICVIEKLSDKKKGLMKSLKLIDNWEQLGFKPLCASPPVKWQWEMLVKTITADAL